MPMRAALNKIATFIPLIKMGDLIMGKQNAEADDNAVSNFSTKIESPPETYDCLLAS
jgi:hypothetical protein